MRRGGVGSGLQRQDRPRDVTDQSLCHVPEEESLEALAGGVTHDDYVGLRTSRFTPHGPNGIPLG
jgi:hypothetical protein